MKEAGDGLYAQMNSMMGALQELKLLQVQTALGQLDISGLHTRAPLSSALAPQVLSSACEEWKTPCDSRTPVQEEQRRFRHRSSLDTSSCSSGLESGAVPLPLTISGYSAPQEDYCGPRVSPPPPAPHHYPQPPTQMADLPRILHSLSSEGPSLDSTYSQEGTDDSSDWTSSLMSRCRNRQPLVLGDNVFADLVGNWLDLPELDKGPLAPGEDEQEEPAHSLSLSRSQEICKRFSLSANIFKKFLRSVRPDRDKLLQEKPGWMPQDGQEAELFKRPKKADKPKGPFYLPFGAGGPQGKVSGTTQATLREAMLARGQNQFFGAISQMKHHVDLACPGSGGHSLGLHYARHSVGLPSTICLLLIM
ncbi:PAK4-inhibitor INKA2-like isoform X2 [Scleropages formosus]|uniref:PAK4-inhibitor INKA2 n=2 Tax=Scleropages formosus TaxID=113540 RepID=A0A8C9S2S8_SCLFO|nr:PAK4-inhibitor INKA2-like isoform X2 [Scleropages formosus]XP_018601238.1 PAK4-inhibitor INKA2-like isoform X2 [Scleropages formosus]